MNSPSLRARLIRLFVFVALIVGAVVAWPWVQQALTSRAAAEKQTAEKQSAEKADPPIKLIDGGLSIPAERFTSGRYHLAEVTESPPPEPLKLNGSVVVDPNRQARVHTLFNGQIVRIGVKGGETAPAATLSDTPEIGLRTNDVVKKGQILAILWSKDVGEKKSELIDQISQMRADKKVLDRYKSVDPGIVTLNQLTVAQRAYEADINSVARVERTLRSWQVTEEEIEVVRREAEQIQNPNAVRDKELERSWAEMPIRAPFDGVIVEKNVTVGDAVDPTVDLFKIAKLDRMQVQAHAYEEDLAKLRALLSETEPEGSVSPGVSQILKGPSARSWTVNFTAQGRDATERGQFDKLGAVIDPMQFTGTVTGWVDNPRSLLFIGQHVTTTIPLRPDPTLVAVPVAALVEDADGSAVLVQRPGKPTEYERRRVTVAFCGREVAFLRREADPHKKSGVRVGEKVIDRRAVELAGELAALEQAAANQKK